MCHRDSVHVQPAFHTHRVQRGGITTNPGRISLTLQIAKCVSISLVYYAQLKLPLWVVISPPRHLGLKLRRQTEFLLTTEAGQGVVSQNISFVGYSPNSGKLFLERDIFSQQGRCQNFLSEIQEKGKS